MIRLAFESRLMHEQACTCTVLSIKGSGAAQINMYTDKHYIYGNADKRHEHITKPYSLVCSQTAAAIQNMCISVSSWVEFIMVV